MFANSSLAVLSSALLSFPLLVHETPQEPAPGPVRPEDEATQEALVDAFAEQGIRFDREAGVLGFPATIEVRNELLEYLLVLPHGAVHEALFVTDVDAKVLNAAFLALGLERGTNVAYVAKDPSPTEEEVRAGVRSHEVVPPHGDGVHLYATWREGDEAFFHRIEDLVRDLDRGRTMRRHEWVFLGSRTLESRNAAGPVFAASAEGNLACISFFAAGNTLLTAALPECVAQTTWLPNAWLLPESTSPVLLIASRTQLVETPTAFVDAVPVLAASEPPPSEPAADGR